jgi:hypothetical protein
MLEALMALRKQLHSPRELIEFIRVQDWSASNHSVPSKSFARLSVSQLRTTTSLKPPALRHV